MFRTHYWLTEVTMKPQGTELYQAYRRGLDTERLYAAVGEQVRELRQFYEERAQRRIGSLLAVITFAGVPATLLFSVYSGIGLVAHGVARPWGRFAVVALICYLLIAICFFIWYQLGREV